MKIHVNRIPYEGLREEASYDPKTLEMGRFDVFLEKPSVVSSFITKADQEMVVQAKIQCVLRLCCARCLDAFDWPLDASAMLNYQVAPTDVVDITEDIRQEIIVAYPMIPICQPDCKGLCGRCGQNLNQGACGCERAREASASRSQ
jgi:uncharacterized protein